MTTDQTTTTATAATECAPGQHNMENGRCTRCPAVVTAGPVSLAVKARGRRGTMAHADFCATEHHAALVAAGDTVGPITVVDGEPGFDVAGGRRIDVDGRDLRPGHFWAPMSGRAFEVTFVAKARGARRGWIRVQYRDEVGNITEQHVKPSEKLTVETQAHRRSFDARGGMAITRKAAV